MSLTPLTPAGHKKLQDELQDLKSVQRPQVIDAIAKARAHGDLKENGEYHAAREQQAFIEGRIRELESKIASSQIIDITTLPNKGKVIFGCTVSLVDEVLDEALAEPMTPIEWNPDESVDSVASNKNEGDIEAVTTH